MFSLQPSLNEWLELRAIPQIKQVFCSLWPWLYSESSFSFLACGAASDSSESLFTEPPLLVAGSLAAAGLLEEPPLPDDPPLLLDDPPLLLELAEGSVTMSLTVWNLGLNRTMTAVMLSQPVPSPIVSGAKQWSNSWNNS